VGTHAGKRRAAGRGRPSRSRLLATVAGVTGLVLILGIVAGIVASAGGPVRGLFSTSAGSGPTRSGAGSASGTHSGTASATSSATASGSATDSSGVVPGAHLQRHQPTAAELDARFAAKGLERVGRGGRQTTSFRVSSFNVLGAMHTSSKGSAHPRWPAGPSRIGRAVGLLRAYDISVVGFQEFEVPQYRAFLGATGGSWGVYPGDSLGSQPTDNSIAWRRSDWTLVEAATTPIPYYGPAIPMPHVLLRNVHTGREVWFANYHNASNDYGNAQGKRDAAVRIEAALVRQLAADGTPVIETGDYNDRQRAACPMMSLAGMHASDGSTYSGARCSVPMRPYPTVDWVFGTPAVAFSGHVADWSTRAREISDHEMIRTSASVAPRIQDPGCVSRRVAGKRLWWCPAASHS